MQAEHNFAATYQEGIVSAVDDLRHRVRVRFPALENLTTDWLSVLAPNAGGNRFYCLPDVGELVACLLDARGEGGVVLGAIYNTQDMPSRASRDIWCKEFTNGTVIEHNRKNGHVLVSTPGAVTVKAASSVTIDSPQTTITGKLTVGGAISAASTISAGGNITGGGISLSGHTHPNPEGGNTGTAQ